MQRVKEALEFFWVCLVMDAVCFGGGYGMIALMERELSQKRNLVTKEELTDILAVAQSLPGMISVNAIIIVGYRKGGVFYALAGVIGMALPSIIFLCLIALAYSHIITNRYVLAVFMGIRAGVIALLTSVVIKLAKGAVKDFVTIGLLVWATAMLMLRETVLPWFNPIYAILIAAVIGVVIKSLGRAGKKQKEVIEINRGDIEQ